VLGGLARRSDVLDGDVVDRRGQLPLAEQHHRGAASRARDARGIHRERALDEPVDDVVAQPSGDVRLAVLDVDDT
jgi:hypothetical protein